MRVVGCKPRKIQRRHLRSASNMGRHRSFWKTAYAFLRHSAPKSVICCRFQLLAQSRNSPCFKLVRFFTPKEQISASCNVGSHQWLRSSSLRECTPRQSECCSRYAATRRLVRRPRGQLCASAFQMPATRLCASELEPLIPIPRRLQRNEICWRPLSAAAAAIASPCRRRI